VAYDVIVVGAGFSGATFARKAADMGQKVLLLEQREHIGGNCYDYRDENGILIHPYGPHLFHTDNEEVVAFLSRFTEWKPYRHKVRVRIGDQEVPLPINFSALETLFPHSDMGAHLRTAFGDVPKVSIFELLESDNEAIQKLGRYIHDKVFLNYTLKQWGTTPDGIDPSVLRRVPVRLSYTDGYFDDTFQQMPLEGFTPLFERMLAHPHITLELGCNALERLHVSSKEVIFDDARFEGTLIYTGMLDALFGYRYDALPYRSLRFEFEMLDIERFQESTVVNYPAAPRMTRITEFKHIYNTVSQRTAIAKEYPEAYVQGANLPYYPLFTPASQEAYRHYGDLCSGVANLIALGRLAQYRYYDMDDVVANALAFFERYALTQDAL